MTNCDNYRQDYSGQNFSGRDLEEMDFTECNLSGANFSGADLTRAILHSANCRGANFEGANLTRTDFVHADLTGAKGLPIAPVVKDIDAKILAIVSATPGTSPRGHLKMCRWHTCSTTHCRGGWAIKLAGDAGAELEFRTSCYLAARLIYEASRPGVPAPDFYATAHDALEDLRASALSR